MKAVLFHRFRITPLSRLFPFDTILDAFSHTGFVIAVLRDQVC